jgi:DNA-binding MarR family transcriptional regulator
VEARLQEELAQALRTIYRAVDLIHDEMLQVTPKELGLLLVIEDNGPTRVKDLAGRVGLPLSTVSWTADKLVVRKLLSRKPDPGDRRAILLTLTRTGRAAIKAHYAIFDHVAHAALSVLAPGERESIIGAVKKIAANLS